MRAWGYGLVLLALWLCGPAWGNYLIDFGDGVRKSVVAQPWTSGQSVTIGQHAYANKGLYRVRVTGDVDCNGDGVADATGVIDTLIVNVGNVRQSINFGDGSPPVTSNQPPCSSPLTPVGHAYSAPGSYLAQYLAVDNTGGLLSDDVQVVVQGIHHLQVSSASVASTCQPQQVIVRACLDANCNQVNAAYAGTILLSTSSGHGTWGGGSGGLNDATVDDGQASYTFSATDQGVAVLQLANVHADDLTIDVVEQGGGANGTSSVVSFRDNAFVITPQTCTGISCPATGSSEVVAGRPHRFELALWRKDPATGLCAIAAEYDSARLPSAGKLKLWRTVDVQDPGGVAPVVSGVSVPTIAPTANNLTLNFVAGKATLTLNTSDVGKYRLEVQDDSSGFASDAGGQPRPIQGSGPLLTVRPFALSVRNVQANGLNNPASNTPSGSAFACAGCPFTADVVAVSWDAADDANGDGLPETGSTLADNPPVPAYAWPTNLVTAGPYTPAWGVLGTLNGGALSAAGFAAGKQAVTLDYSEVGSMTLRARATGFLGTPGVDVTDQGGWVVGRFYPFDFQVTLNGSPALAPGNGSFTYLGQAFGWKVSPTVTITARNKAGSTTKNYDGSWWKLPDIVPAYAANTALPANVTLDTTSATVTGFSNCRTSRACQGSATVSFGGQFVLMRQSAQITPFDFNLKISFPVDDGEARYANNPYVISSIAFDDGDPATTTDSQMRSGRALLNGSYGQPNQALRLYFWTQYYTADGFVNNDADTVTRYTADATNPACSVLRGPIACSNVSVSGTAGHGQWFDLSAPGVAGALRYTLNVDPWLQYDWNGDGNLDNDPAADVVWGIFRGDDRVIHWREQR